MGTRAVLWAGIVSGWAGLASGCGGCPGDRDRGGGGGGDGRMHFTPIEPGTPVELSDLCRALAQGYIRVAAAEYAVMNDNAGPACPLLLTDAEAQDALVDPDSYYTSFCGPDGSLVPTLADLSRAVADGRVQYNPAQAGELMRLGRTYFNSYGGIVGALSGSDGGQADVSALLAALQQVVVGQVPPGGACVGSAECAQTASASRACVLEDPRSCGSVCRLTGGEGDPCGPGRPPCSSGFRCVRGADAGTSGSCVSATPRPQGAVCQEGGADFPCEDDLRCLSGVCRPPGSAGATCSSDPDCVNGLQCISYVCAPARTLGARCSYTDDCPVCSTCERLNDGGRVCAAVAGEGEPCAFARCRMGLTCAAGLCVRAPRGGEPCQRATADAGVAGACFSARHACVGDPPTCQPRGASGQRCEVRPGTEDRAGTCGPDLYCRRASTDETEGTCAEFAGEGEACGTTPGLAPACRGALECELEGGDGGQGICLPQPRAAGDLCSYSSDCSTDSRCVGDAGVRRCVAPARVGDTCDPTVGCSDGYCDYFRKNGSFGNWCVPPLAAGQACTSNRQCGADGDCVDGGCTSLLGQECDRWGSCPHGLRCVEGLCVTSACESEKQAAGCVGDLSYLLMYGAVILGGARWRRRTHPPV